MKILYFRQFGGNAQYSKVATNYIKALLTTGVELKTIHLNDINSEPDVNEEERALMLGSCNQLEINKAYKFATQYKPDIFINHLNPELLYIHKDTFNVSISSHNTDRISKHWVDNFNSLQLCVVPSRENSKAYQVSGVKVPVEVVYQAIDIDKYKKEYQPVDIKELADFSFKFYTISETNHEKGLDILFKAYFTEFTGYSDVVLVVNINTPITDGVVQVQKFIQNIKNKMRLNHFPKIMLLNKDINNDNIFRLHAACDAFVLPVRGESWSSAHFDAMALGKYPIATDWNGPTEYIVNGQNGRLIKYEMQPVFGMNHPVPYMYTSYENWAEPSLADLKVAMRESYKYITAEKAGDKFIEYQKMMGLKTVENFSYDKIGKKLLDYLLKHYNKEAKC